MQRPVTKVSGPVAREGGGGGIYKSNKSSTTCGNMMVDTKSQTMSSVEKVELLFGEKRGSECWMLKIGVVSQPSALCYPCNVTVCHV